MVMDSEELNEAILGAMYRESREMKLPRLIAYLIGRDIGAIKRGTKITDFHPLTFDGVAAKKKPTKEEIERMDRIHAERDAKRKALINGK